MCVLLVFTGKPCVTMCSHSIVCCYETHSTHMVLCVHIVPCVFYVFLAMYVTMCSHSNAWFMCS